MPMMRRRPLLRAAAVGGGAYMAGKSRQRGQEREYDQEQRLADLEAQQAAPPMQMAPPPQPMAPPPPPVAPPAPAAAAGPTDDMIARLTQLGQLHDQGVLTDEEFAQQKARVLG
jgi:hypothetical protein